MNGHKLDDYDFSLPEELIAQYPAVRGESRLLVWDRKTGSIRDSDISSLADFLPKPAVIVFNDSKVRRARLLVKLETGRDSEIVLLSRVVQREGGSAGIAGSAKLPDAAQPGAAPARWKALTKNSRRLRPGAKILLPDGTHARVTALHPNGVRELEFEHTIDEAWLDRHGHLPLPPYIRRQDEGLDRDRYQTVFARVEGSAAAPTAGLHFNETILSGLQAAGIQTAWVTLHVGLGTFLPVRSQNITEHNMHEEGYSIPQATADTVNAAKLSGVPVLACGTTSVRTLESAWDSRAGRMQPGEGATSIFIRPGYQFGAVDKLFTNFHTPKSSLLMLVAAFAGLGETQRVYKHAVESRYRFFSYGDAMLIL